LGAWFPKLFVWVGLGFMFSPQVVVLLLGQQHAQQTQQSPQAPSVEMPNTYAHDYYKQYVPYYNQLSQGPGNRDELLEKLNYMIHLLEAQQHEKTNNITEEFLLYTFLGVFVIYVLDSFARGGKYIR
jgi:hypothetical protein